MSGLDAAKGFDLVVGIGLDALQAFVLPAAGIPLPREATLGGTPIVNGSTVSYRVGTPLIDVEPDDNDPQTPDRLLLRCPLDFTLALATSTTSFVDGEIVLSAVPASPSNVQAVLDVDDSRKTQSTPGSGTPPTGVTAQQIQQIVEAITTEVAAAVNVIPLHRPIRPNPNPDVDQVEQIAVRFAERSTEELHLMVRTGAEHVDPASPDQIPPFLGDFENSGLLLRNAWLLEFLIKPAIEKSFPGKVFNFTADPPKIESDSSSDPLFQNGDQKIHSLHVTVDANAGRLVFGGKISDEGRGWSAEGTFEFFVTIDCDENNVLNIVSTEPVIDVDVDLAWWRVLAGIVGAIVLGAIAFLVGGPAAGPALAWGIVGAVLGFVLGASVGGEIIEGFITEFATGALAGAVDTATAPFRLGGLKDFDLPVTVEGLTLGDVHFDDLVMTGRIRRRSASPVFGQGTVTLRDGDTLDLDTGRLEPGGMPDFALEKFPGFLAHLEARNGARFSSGGGGFFALTQDDLAVRSYTEQGVLLGPLVGGPFGPKTVLVRTSEGLFAKLRLKKQGDELEVRYVTYAVAGPRHMTIEGDAKIVDRAPAFTSGGGRLPRPPRPLLGVDQVQHEAWYWVENFDARAPLQYAWSFDGTPIAVGQETAIEGGAVATAFADGLVRVTTAMGVVFDGRLQAVVRDASGKQSTATRYVSLPATEKSRPVVEGGFGSVPGGSGAGAGGIILPGRPELLDDAAFVDRVRAISVGEEVDFSTELVAALARGDS